MAINEINKMNSVVPTVPQGLERIFALRATPSPADILDPVPVAAASIQGLTPAQQAALLINDTLQSLNFVAETPADTLLFNETNPIVTAVIAAQDLTPAQQTALLVNETLQGLSFVPSSPVDALLINETAPDLTTVIEPQNLTPAQQATLLVNETFQDLTVQPLAAAATVPATTGAAAQLLPPAPLLPPLINVTAGGPTAGVTPGLNLAAPQAATPAQLTTPAPITTAVIETLPITQPAVAQLVVDRNPIAVNVYEIRNPTPVPPDPKPVRKDTLPPLPIGRVRPVDRLLLRREWWRRRRSGPRQEVPPRPPLMERSIRQMVSQANEDLAANGLPLRLVLAKNDEGYSLDIYDCSDDTVCRLTREVPLDLNKLQTILDNIQHETGIIVNTMT